MASASLVKLTRLLLQRSDRHPIGRLDGNDQRTADAAVFLRFLNLGLLTEATQLSDSDGIMFETIGGRVWGFCADGTGNADVLTQDDLRQFKIDLTAVCRQIRKANQIEGPPLEPLGPFAMRIGAIGSGSRRRQYFLVRALRPKNALDLAYTIRGHADDGAVVILTPTERNLPDNVIRLLRSTQIEIIPIDAHLDENAAEPLVLNLLRTPQGMPIDEPELFIDTGGHRVCFHGAEVSLTPRELNVLVVLANEAAHDAGVVSQHVLLDCLRGSDDNEEALPEQLQKVISLLRTALTSAAGLPREHGRKLIISKRGIGYRLDIQQGNIRIV